MRWEDYFFIVKTSGKWAGYRYMANDPAYIIVDRLAGVDPRQVHFRTKEAALRSIMRLMKLRELEAEKALLGRK